MTDPPLLALAALLVSYGALLLVFGVRGIPSPPGRMDSPRIDVSRYHVIASVVVGSGLFLLTGWWAFGLLGTIIGWALPGLRASVEEVRRSTLVERELARWLETLRGSVVSGTAINRAIEDSVSTAHPEIRQEIDDLAVAIRRYDLRSGLRGFAATMRHPLVDVVVLSLILTDRHGGEREEVLDRMVRRLRRQISARQDIAASRRSVHVQVVIVLVVTVLILAYLLVFSGDYLAPYETTGGQFVLLGVGTLFGLAAFGMRRLTREEPELRPFAKAFTDELEQVGR